MPIKKAGFKAVRQSKKSTARNSRIKEQLKKSIKISRKMVDDKKADEAKAEILKTVRMIDKATSKGILKKNTAARKKSRLMKKLKGLGK